MILGLLLVLFVGVGGLNPDSGPLQLIRVQILESEIYGAYVATYTNGSETLVLRSDGTFQQDVRPDGRPAVTNSGRWFLGRNHQVIEIPYPQCMSAGFREIESTLKADAGCTLQVRRRWGFFGQLRIDGGDEDPAPYWKVD